MNLFGTITSEKLSGKVAKAISTFQETISSLREVAVEAREEVDRKQIELTEVLAEIDTLKEVESNAINMAKNIQSLISPKKDAE